MKERPILFNADMVRAILEGRKTQTRRVVKPQPPAICETVYAPYQNEKDRFVGLNDDAHQIWHGSCPYGKPGDQLWARETFQHSDHPYGPLTKDCHIFYRADYRYDPHGMDGEKSPEGKYREWRPSIHMPRWASRIQLEITGVRAERIQDISEPDAQAEGAQFVDFGKNRWGNQLPGWRADRKPTHHEESLGTARYAFANLWESINGPGSWEANPWVWVVELQRIKP